MVSMQMASAPPLARAVACSAKAASISSSVQSSISSIMPVGPTEAITQRWSPAAAREQAAAARLISALRPARP